MLSDEMPYDAVDSIFSNASRILSHCPNPRDEMDSSETGIVIGKVQSGKTSNFISVLALAFDNGYEIAVVLGGNTNMLLDQNKKRIESAFNVDANKLTVLTTKDNKSLVTPARIKEFLENGRKIIIVGLKHHKHINQIAEIFENEYLSNKPVIVVDDEGDQATLNTKAYRKSMSSTYESVLKLKSSLKRHCFLSITATPQANILIEAFDKLSPDFGELVYPGEGYCGLQAFHGENEDKHVYEIPASEGNLIDDAGVPASLFEAMAMFFIGNAIRYSRGDMDNHAMLIHPSQKKPDHKTVVAKIQGVLDDWKSRAKLRISGSKDVSYSALQKHLRKAYDAFIDDGVVCAPFEDLEMTALNRIKECSPAHICNSDENASEDSRLYKTNIFVGGNLVERGITIKGLAVTYITRRAKGKSNVDNVEQRARWFGYKAKYLDVCRVFATKEIKADFVSILEHDEDMWASIERARDRGIPFKEMPKIFILARSAFLNLTRTNVARAEAYSLSEWKPQKYLILDEHVASINANLINLYRNRKSADITMEKHNNIQLHAVLKCQSYQDVYSELLEELTYGTNEVLNKKYFGLLRAALEKQNINPNVDVYWVRDVAKTTRKIGDDGTIQQLFQGRNPNNSSPLYYNGDRSLVDKDPDNIQLQIHFVKPTNMDAIHFYSPVLALYIPEWCAKELSALVVKTNG